MEAITHINKAGIALLMGALMWMVVVQSDGAVAINHLSTTLSKSSEILFFLLGAMTIVELIDAHNGFDVVARFLNFSSKTKLTWVIAILAFILSAILDNLTTTIVMVTLIRKIIPEQLDRRYLAGLIIIAANAGGAWSPVGDVTTTMLWIGGQISPLGVIGKVILPSILCLIIPTWIISLQLKGSIISILHTDPHISLIKRQRTVLISGIIILLLVPVIKQLTGLPPYMGMLSGLGFMWILLEFLDRKKKDETKSKFTVENALQRIDTPSILFFLGILLSIGALEQQGVLHYMASYLKSTLNSDNTLIINLGVLSAILDNVPLVAATQAMFDFSTWPQDSVQWHFLAYASGTGGSVLIIGSAAGVAAMGLENINFIWYLKKITLPALIGFLVGCLPFLMT